MIKAHFPFITLLNYCMGCEFMKTMLTDGALQPGHEKGFHKGILTLSELGPSLYIQIFLSIDTIMGT